MKAELTVPCFSKKDHFWDSVWCIPCTTELRQIFAQYLGWSVLQYFSHSLFSLPYSHCSYQDWKQRSSRHYLVGFLCKRFSYWPVEDTHDIGYNLNSGFKTTFPVPHAFSSLLSFSEHLPPKCRLFAWYTLWSSQGTCLLNLTEEFWS